LRVLARQAVPRLLEGVIAPTVLFWVLFRTGGVWLAIAGGFAWSSSVIGVRLMLRRRVPTLVVVGLGFILLRTALAFATHNSFFYFVQPTLATTLIGITILMSAAAGRPITLRLARDFCPLPADSMRNAHLRRFFLGISALWGATQLINAGVTTWLLLSQSVGTYVVTRAAVSYFLSFTAITVSVVWFRRVARTMHLAAATSPTP
jgi:intracellular septation protein A